MKQRRFDERWRRLVRSARKAGWETAGPNPVPEPADVWRRLGVRETRGSGESVDWWQWYGVRGLAVASVVLAVCAWISVHGAAEAPGWRPGVEDVVAQAFWLL